MNTKSSGYTGLGWAIILVGLIVYPILYGWALSLLWAWFVVPIFELPLLSIPVAIGVSMTVRMVTNQDAENKKAKEGELVSDVFVNVFAVLITIGLGWLVQLFV